MLPVGLGPLPEFDSQATPIARTYFYDAEKDPAHKEEITFACEFVLEFLSVITAEQIQELYQKLGVTISLAQAVAINKAADTLHIEYINPGIKVPADTPLLKVTGDPLAVELVDTLISSVTGMMSAVATNCREIVDESKETFDFKDTVEFSSAKLKQIIDTLPIAKKPDDEHLRLLDAALRSGANAEQIIETLRDRCKFPAPIFKVKLRDLLAHYAKEHADILDNPTFRDLFTRACDDRAHSYFGLRRGGPCSIPLIELAALRGGFGSMANISTRLDFKFAKFPEPAVPVVGTMAHAFIMIQTAMFKQAVDEGNLGSLLDALGITKEQYISTRRNPKIDIADYVSFRAYIRAVQEFEKEAAAAGKPAPKPIILLVDTTDTLGGISAAIQACIDTGRPLTGVRLDTTPAKFLVEAAKLLDAAAKQRPDLFAHTRLFCTDNISKEGAKEIEDLCRENDILRPISYGIGSNIANTEPFILKHTQTEVDGYVPDPNFPNKFSVSAARKTPSKTLIAALKGDMYEHPHLPADAYAPNQALLLQQLAKLYATKPELKTVQKVTASLHFRPRDESQNYLLIAGTDVVIRFLKGFMHDDEFIETLRKCGLGMTEPQIKDLYKDLYKDLRSLKGRGLDLDIAAVPDGTELLPGQPILTITGRPEDVLLVESFCTSVIGGMSAVATAADQLLAPVKKMPKAKRPKFYYAGLEHQRVPSPYNSFAAQFVFDGSTAFTMTKDCVTPHVARADCLDFDGNVDDLIPKMLQVGTDKACQIRGNFTAEQVAMICERAEAAGIKISNVEFLVVGPLAAATNPKGLVYKMTGVELADAKHETAYQHVLKAAGATAVPGKKTSIPGIEPETLVIKDNTGQVLALMIIDLHQLRKTLPAFSMNDPNAILKHILSDKDQPHVHFERSAASKDKAALITLANIGNLNAEFMLRRPDPKDDTACRAPKVGTPKESLEAAIKRQEQCSTEQYRDAPVLISGALYQKSCELLRAGINDDYYLDSGPRLRNVT